ncbi:MAG TPA: ATP-binding protein, partial [Archangium sp.]
LDLFALQASAKRIEIGYAIAPDVPAMILGDATRLRQVIVNLVHNAVKFTPSGRISVEVRPLSPLPVTAVGASDPCAGLRTTLEFTVRDSGIGIPPDRLDRLFEAFSQIDSSATRRYGGTGLGLATCFGLVSQAGGRIELATDVTSGACFVVTLPRLDGA